jgi:hypothetical protein
MLTYLMKVKTPTIQLGKKVLRMNKRDKYLVIAHGTTDGVAKAKEIIKGTESCGIDWSTMERRWKSLSA